MTNRTAKLCKGRPKQKVKGSKRQNSKPVLLVEDDHIDAMTAKCVLKNLKIRNQVVHVANGEAALKYLRTESDNKPFTMDSS